MCSTDSHVQIVNCCWYCCSVVSNNDFAGVELDERKAEFSLMRKNEYDTFCTHYVTLIAMAPNQLVDYIVGTLWYTLTSLMTWASEVNLSKFWPPDTVYLHGPINPLPCLLSYHYKQKLQVDVSMHRCPVSLPAGGHSKRVVKCGAPRTVLVAVLGISADNWLTWWWWAVSWAHLGGLWKMAHLATLASAVCQYLLLRVIIYYLGFAERRLDIFLFVCCFFQF